MKPEEVYLLGDEGRTLTVEAPSGSMGSLISGLTVACVLDETNAPDSMASKLKQTSALSGTQEESWDDIDVTWTFNASVGFNAVFTQDE